MIAPFRAAAIGICSALVTTCLALAPATSAPAVDSFYVYDGSEPLSSYEPGEVLKTRTLPYHVAGIPVPLTAVQLLYRTTDQQGRPMANVTSVVLPPVPAKTPKVLSYQSFYDSLDPEHGPSRSIAGDVSLGGAIANIETLLFAPALLQGYTVVVPDTEGPDADFAAGPEYGMTTLDSVRAALSSSEAGLLPDTKVGLVGYSGGAIATGWAAQLADTYAPDLSDQLIGAAEGGLLVAPAHNLRYISGSLVWAGVAAMAVVGVGRAFDIDFAPYVNEYGASVLKEFEKKSIIEVLGQYPGLTWKQLVKPQYANPNTIPEFVHAVNALNRGSADSPTMPVMIGQAANGLLEGTPGNKPGIGRGDGVMIAGDVRTLARQFCADGTDVHYTQYELLSHATAVPVWLPAALVWLNGRFAGKPAPNNCWRIAPGNSLAPEVVAP